MSAPDLKCSGCKQYLHKSLFSRDASYPRGYCYYCKACTKVYALSPNIVKSKRIYAASKAGREAAARTRRKHPLRARVRELANNARKRGELVQLPCWTCNDPKSEMHHVDYDYPLQVIWLCRAHHSEVHQIS